LWGPGAVFSKSTPGRRRQKKRLKYNMVKYIFLENTILEVSSEESRLSNSSPLFVKNVKAVDVQNEKKYNVPVEYSLVFSKVIENSELDLDQLIFMSFKKYYDDHLAANTLEKLQGENTPSIKLDEVESLFSDPPPMIELQNHLISILNRAFRIKQDIQFTLDDLIVSTGYRQEDLESALSYLKHIEVIEKIPAHDENNKIIDEHVLDEKYSIKKRIRVEYDKLESTKERKFFSNKYFREIKIEPKTEFCFVLMPFKDEEFPQNWYSGFLKPFITGEFKIDCFRVDDDFLPNKIDDKLYTYILRSKFIIAEISTLNPNVMYEVGMAHTLNKDVILLAKENLNKIPFDIDKFRICKYSDEEDLKDYLKKTIPGLIK
jgi:hypothetical protein